MPSIYDLKPKFQALLRPVSNTLAAAGITANQVTIAAAALSILVGGLIALHPQSHWPLLLLPVFLFVRMALNAIDGMLAREHAMKSRLGGFLNELGDVVSDTALYLPLGLVPGIPIFAVAVAVALAGMTELAGVLAITVGAKRRYDGPMGKSDRAFSFGLLSLLLGSGVHPGVWASWFLWAVVLLLAITIINRTRKALAEGAAS